MRFSFFDKIDLKLDCFQINFELDKIWNLENIKIVF